MAMLVQNGRLAEDPWQPLTDDETLPPRGDVILGLSRWLSEEGASPDREGRTGVLLKVGDDPAPLLPRLAGIPLIAIEFPAYADGRGYSVARLLRQVHDYRGELRAVGDVRRDEADHLRRCGFDSLLPAGGQSAESLLSAFGEVGRYPGQP